MRITRFIDEAGQIRTGRDRGDGAADVIDRPIFPASNEPIRPAGPVARIVRRLAPLEPTNIFCIGLNYRAHAAETGARVPENPVVFMKPTTAVIGDGEPIVIPAACTGPGRGDEVDYECELAVVIGRTARDVEPARALDHVLGYTVANDVSARRWQKQGGGGQWVRGKSFDTFCPLGPALVTAGEGDDAIADPQALTLSTQVNGQRRQHSTTADMIFSVAELIAFLSRDTTLAPGTVILTGTPAGVGLGRTPPAYLQPGDEVVVEIDRIGSLVNPVISAAQNAE